MSKHLITIVLAAGLVAVLTTLGLASMEWSTINITKMPVSLTYVDPQSGKKVFRNLSGLVGNFIVVDRDDRNHHAISLHTEGKDGVMVIDANAVGSGFTSGTKTSVLACQQVDLDTNTIVLDAGLKLTPDVVLMKVDYTKDAADTASFNIKMTAAGVLDHLGTPTPGQVVVSATVAGVHVQPVSPNISIGRDFAFANSTGVNPTATDHIVSFDFGDKGTVDLAQFAQSFQADKTLNATVNSGPFDGPFNGSIKNSNNIVNGLAEYTPATGFSGGDSFTYFLRDSVSHKSDIKTVSVKVSERPVAHDVQLSRFVFKNQTSAVFVNFTAFVEHHNHNIHFGNITGVEHGRLSSKDHHLGRVAYRPNPGYAGEDHFHYSIDDKLGFHQEAIVTLSVVPFAVDDDFFVRAFTANAVTLDVLADDKGTDFIGTPPVTPLEIVSVVKLTTTTSTVAISTDKKHILYTPGNSPVLSDDSFMYEVEDTRMPLLNRPVSAAVVRVHITP